MKPFLKVIQLHKSESELINQAIKNNRKAQHLLFELHAPKMLSVWRCCVICLIRFFPNFQKSANKSMQHINSVHFDMD